MEIYINVEFMATHVKKYILISLQRRRYESRD